MAISGGDGSIILTTKVDESGLKTGLSSLKSGVGKLGTAFAAVGTAAVAAFAGVTAAAINAKTEFETTAAKASTLFGDVDVDAQKLNSSILEISSSTGMAATELNEALYSALSAGIPVTEDMTEATGFLENAAKLAKAGFTDVDTAISATAKTLNAYGLDVSEAERIQGILIQTQNKGITTVGELGASLAQVTPTAAAFGVSFENVGAALATMTAKGTPTAQATTQLNSLIAELGKNGTVAAKNLEKAAQNTEYAGMSFNEIMNSGASLADVLTLIGDQAEKDGVSMVDMFSSIEAGKAALSIASGEAETFNENLLAMNDTTGLVNDAFSTMNNTIQGSFDQLKESWNNVLIAMATPDADLTAPVNALIESLGTVIDNLAPIIVNISESVLKVLEDLLGKLPEFIDKLLPTVVSGATKIIQGLINTLPKLVETVIGVLPQLIFALLDMLPQLLDAGIQIILSLAQGIVDALPDLIPKAVEIILTIVQGLIDNLDELLYAALDIIVALATGLIDAIPELLEKLPEIITSIVLFLTDPANLFKIIEAAILIMAALIEGIIKSIPAIIEGLAKIPPKMIAKLKESFSDFKAIGKHLIDGLWQGILNTKDWLLNKIKSFAHTITEGIKKFFGISSPSKVFRDEVGKNLMLGMAEGITGNEIAVSQAMARVQQGLANTSLAMPTIMTGNIVPYHINATATRSTVAPQATANANSTPETMVVREEHYHLNEHELMTILHKLVKGGARLEGKSMTIVGGAY